MESRFDGGARLIGRFQNIDRLPDDRALHVDVVWFSARIAERHVGVDEPWYTAMLRDIECRAQDDGRHAFGFEVTGDQTHGLVANRSQRYQQRDVDGILAAASQELRCVALEGLRLAVGCRGAVEAFG